jgi:3-methyladenine DNA glycosylase/8-oxoguanine DNA glycosylase
LTAPSTPQRRTFVTDFAVDLAGTLRPLARGSRNPAMRLGPREAWRVQHTPCGPATLHIAVDSDRCTVQARAWGDGAEWSVAHAPDLVGAADDPDAFVPRDDMVRALMTPRSRVRLGRTVAVYDLATTAVIEQRVTGLEARRTWQALLRRYGEPAPGPSRSRPQGLRMFPRPAVVAALGDAARRAVGLEMRRGVALSAVAADARGLDRAAALGPEVLDRRLRSHPGVGLWTSAVVRAHGVGDADAVPVGDWHIPRAVVAALTGETVARRLADERMLELLEPYRPHRYRVVLLALASGGLGPRHYPRAEIPDLLKKDASGRPFAVRRTLILD